MTDRDAALVAVSKLQKRGSGEHKSEEDGADTAGDLQHNVQATAAQLQRSHCGPESCEPEHESEDEVRSCVGMIRVGLGLGFGLGDEVHFASS